MTLNVINFILHFSAIVDAPVTDQDFLDNLLNLEQKITFLKEQSFRGRLI